VNWKTGIHDLPNRDPAMQIPSAISIRDGGHEPFEEKQLQMR